MMKFAVLGARASALWALWALVGCDAPATTTRTDIPGARFLAFRCVAADGLGLPLDGCGCTERTEDGTLRRMGRIECDCRALDVDLAEELSVSHVEAVGGVPVVDPDTGDWKPADPAAAKGQNPTAVACSPRRSGSVRGYVGSAQRGEVAVLDISGGDDEGSILDVDRGIPGVTAIFVDDLVSAVAAHPDGDFIFTVNSSSGTLSVIRSDTSVREAYKVELGAGVLHEVAVWPSVARPRPVLGLGARAFVTAPLAGEVLELDLEALGTEETAAAAVTGRFVLPSPDGSIEPPGRLTVTDDGSLLVVAHARRPWVTLFDLASGGPPHTVDLAPRHPCDDGYLVRLLDVDEDDTCRDGWDNDADGLVDADDPDCGATGTEATAPRCPKQSQCVDGSDNDGDGLVDAEDPDCDPAGCVGDDCPPPAAWLDWEGTTPACADGRDNDGDGLADRADPGCRDEGDRDETDAIEIPANGDVCADGADNDGDGLVDTEDPGCTDRDAPLRYRFEGKPRCANGEDDDADGRIDFGADGDPDCFAASDDEEGASAVSVGPTAVETVTVREADGDRTWAYVVDPRGTLMLIDLDDPRFLLYRINLGRVTPLALAARQVGDTASLLMVASDTTLRSLEVSAPTPLVTADGRPIFGRLAVDSLGDERTLSAFYVVEDGVAYAVDGLDDLVEEGRYPTGDLAYTTRTDPVVPFSLPADPAERTPLLVVDEQNRALDRGRSDPLMFADPSVRTALHREANVRLSAQSRTNRVVAEPRFFLSNSPVSYDLRRHATFCRLPQPDPSSETGVTPSEQCVPVGYTPQGQIEADDDQAERTRFRVDSYEGIQVVEDDPSAIISGVFSLTYQGELPNTESRTGQFVSREDDLRWTMVDYSADFCARGVEVGDILLVDVFVPATAESAELPECRALQPENRPGDPLQLREPLRYRVAELAAHKLVLEFDDVSNFDAQLPRDDRSAVARYYEAPPAPEAECAAQFIAYRIRAGQDQWLLTGANSGYRHPWVNQDGLCVQSQQRLDARRLGRLQLDESFENEWFRFELGAFRPVECTDDAQCDEGSCIDFRCVAAPCETEDDDCPEGSACDVDAGRCVQAVRGTPATEGIPPGRLPHMVDARFEFEVASGVAHQRLADFAVIPGSLEWLPNDDHVYAVDTAFETVVEAAGLDVYRQVLSFVRQFR